MVAEQLQKVIKRLARYFFVSATAAEVLEVLVDSTSQPYCDLTVQQACEDFIGGASATHEIDPISGPTALHVPPLVTDLWMLGEKTASYTLECALKFLGH
jgi:hypothetical protein